MDRLLEAQRADANASLFLHRALPWEGRSALMPLILASSPIIIFAAIFWTTLILFGGFSASGHFTIGLPFQRPMEIPIDTPFLRFLSRAILAVLLSLTVVAIVQPVWRRRRIYYRISDGTLVVRHNRVHVVWPLTDIDEVTVMPMSSWYAVQFERNGETVATLLVTIQDVRAIADLMVNAGVVCDRSALAQLPSGPTALASGEAVRWTGRPGLRSFDRSRQFACAAGALPIVIFMLLLSWIWRGQESIAMGLFWSLGAFALVGGTSLGVLLHSQSTLRDWFLDATGDIVVTDRRIVWRAPFTRRIYREVLAENLVAAAIVEASNDRGWIALTVRDAAAPGGLAEIDIFGTPDADAAIAAIQMLVVR